MRKLLIVLSLLLFPLTSAHAEISFSIGINVPVYPRLVRVPGYPVYYDPRAQSNYFFYDGLYWVYQGDNWYASSWYNGPWDFVERYEVPLFVLRVPVRYYRQPPVFFRGWRADAPPHWGDHWGRDWEQQRSGWDHWDHRSVPAPAPLPVYQRQYSGERYPRAVEQQHSIRSERYRYEPREDVTRERFQQRSQSDQQRQQQEQKHEQQRNQDQQRRQDQQLKPEQPRQQREYKQEQQSEQPRQQREQKQEQRSEQPRQQREHKQEQQSEQPGQQREQKQESKERGSKFSSQDKGEESQSEPHDRGRGNKNEERGQGRR